MKKSLSMMLLAYFRMLAKIQLHRNRPVVVGITGSAGKSTVMYAVAAVLRVKYQVKISEKANSQSGLSLNLIGLNPRTFSPFDWLRLAVQAPFKVLTNGEKYEVYIAEMGIDSPHEPGNMEYLLKIVRPHIGVFTSVNLVHSQAFDYLVAERDVKKRETAVMRAIAQEKAKLITRLPAAGTAVYNLDDSIVAQACAPTVATKLTVGKQKAAAVRLISTVWKNQGTAFVLQHGKTEAVITLKRYLLPEHYGLSFASAAAVGIALGISLKEAATAISTSFILPPGRATLIPAVNDSTILDSSYNSAPAPLLDFFDLLQRQKDQQSPRKAYFGRFFGLLGDMRELGKLSGYEHTCIAKQASEVFDSLYLVGPQMRAYALPVLKKTKLPVFWFATAAEAADQLKQDLRPKDLLFVKGSQNTILLETAVEKLMATPADASSLLCRRGQYWDQQRKMIT